MSRRRVAACAAGWLLAVAASASAAGRPITLRTSDGRTIPASFTEARNRSAPAVVLVPMLGRSKDDWSALADRLAEAGIHALAIDLPAASVPGDGGLARWADDVTAAITYAVSRPEGPAPVVGIIGASLGANLAVVAAAGDGHVQSLALLSPTLDYRGVRIESAYRQYGARPALLVASLSDPYAARSVRTLVGQEPTTHEVHWSDAVAHGTMLLGADGALTARIVDWFRRTLGLG